MIFKAAQNIELQIKNLIVCVCVCVCVKYTFYTNWPGSYPVSITTTLNLTVAK